MNDRHNTTEDIGVRTIVLLTTKNLGWVFREQPLVDVGIDATIEQKAEGNFLLRLLITLGLLH